MLGAKIALVVALSLARAGVAAAQGDAPVPCQAGNLLAGKRPVYWQDVRGDIRLPTDEAVAPEGSLWNSTPAITLETGASTVTWDLGAVYALQVVLVQADANDVYHLWGSTDGRSYRPLPQVDPAEGVHGLRTRTLALGGLPVRFLRFGDAVGDNAYSLSEITAYCQVPQPFPPKLRVVNAPVAQVQKTFFTYWNNESSARWELALAVLGCLLLFWGADLQRRGKGEHLRIWRDRALMVLGGLSLLTYFNFGFAHFGNMIHDWEWTHYYVGSKYFRELSYDRLYECIAVADVEDGLRHRVETRKLTNLRTNALETTADILAHPERCKAQFTEQRWQDFKHDVKFFRDRQSPRRWDDLQTDHGYNGTPVWNIAGSVLANLAPASKAQLYTLALLDPLYLLAAVGLIWWAFGWRVTCVALMVFATNFPSRFYWTGGSFLRWDWIFYLVASICLLKKDRPMLAGAALGYSTLLRVFPLFVFLGPILAAGFHLIRRRRLEPGALRFFAGAALAVCLLVPVSLQVGGGVEAYRRFAQNTQKHKETPLTNYMGLRTVVAYRPSEAGYLLRNDRYTDPWIKWKEARLRGYQQAKPIYLLLVMAFLVVLGFAVKERPAWQTAALGVTLIPFGVELTCYYYAFIIGVALLHAEDERVGRLLLLLTAFTGFIDWAPFRFMPGWLDEKYTWMSAGTLAIFAVIAWDFGLRQVLAARRAARAGEMPAPIAAVGANAEAAVVVVGSGGAGAGASANKKKKRR
jgi:hypothetical protein